MTRSYIGVDLSKDVLDVCDPDRGPARVANDPISLARWLENLGPEEIVVYEATSRCDAPLRAALRQAARPGVRVNPLYAWHFARSLNLAKTDRVDAAMLARFGAERRMDPDPDTDPARETLRGLARRRDQLKAMATQEKNRLADGPEPLVAADIRAELAGLSARAAGMEAAIAAHLAAHPHLAAADRLLRSIPGVGPTTAAVLLAHLGELGRVDRRALASLSGTAPRANESGQRRGRRSIGEGRRRVRQALYMAALSALRHPGFLADFIRRMKGAGKPGKVIALAVARRLVVIANAVLRTGEPFRGASRRLTVEPPAPDLHS